MAKRGRKKTTDAPRDTRKAYNYRRIESDGEVFHFDGKSRTSNPKELIVYRFHGNITMMEKALQDFALDNGYETVTIAFPY